MTMFLLSLGGFPPMAGFIGKWYIFSAAVERGHYWLAIIGVLTSVMSVFFYLRIVVMMYMTGGQRYRASARAAAGCRRPRARNHRRVLPRDSADQDYRAGDGFHLDYLLGCWLPGYLSFQLLTPEFCLLPREGGPVPDDEALGGDLAVRVCLRSASVRLDVVGVTTGVRRDCLCAGESRGVPHLPQIVRIAVLVECDFILPRSCSRGSPSV